MNTGETRSLLEPRRVGLLAMIAVVMFGAIALGLPRIAGSGETGDVPGESLSMNRKQEIDPPKDLPDFTLTDQEGQPASLSDFRGQPLLMFFGFTHCPDICPATLAEFRIIKRELGDLGDDVTFMLISVDGSRDTPESLKAYVEQFDPEFVGLTGDETRVREIGLDYFLYFNRVGTQESSSAAGYQVDHTSYSYLIDAEGKLRTIYPFQAPREMIVEDLRAFISASAGVAR